MTGLWLGIFLLVASQFPCSVEAFDCQSNSFGSVRCGGEVCHDIAFDCEFEDGEMVCEKHDPILTISMDDPEQARKVLEVLNKPNPN